MVLIHKWRACCTPVKKINTCGFPHWRLPLVTLQVSVDEPSSSVQVVDIGVLTEFYKAFEEVREPA